MIVLPPANGALRFRRTAARMVRFFTPFSGTASLSLKLRLQSTMPPGPRTYCSMAPMFSIGLDVL